MKTAVVTSSDKNYIPGVKALYASYLKNSKHEGDFFLLAHGNRRDFLELEKKGVNILYNKETIDSPTSCNWHEKLPAMYSRLLVPELFSDYDRVLFVDADVVILKEIVSLLTITLNDYPCAAMLPADPRGRGISNNYMHYQMENPEEFPEYKKVLALQAGVMLFDIKRWNKLNITKEVNKILVSGIKFKFVVQGLLGFVLKGNFKPIPMKWNARVSKVTIYDIKNIHILHYVGGKGRNPWEKEMRFIEIWKEFYESFSVL